MSSSTRFRIAHSPGLPFLNKASSWDQRNGSRYPDVTAKLYRVEPTQRGFKLQDRNPCELHHLQCPGQKYWARWLLSRKKIAIFLLNPRHHEKRCLGKRPRFKGQRHPKSGHDWSRSKDLGKEVCAMKDLEGVVIS